MLPAVVLAVGVSGCSGSFSIPPQRLDVVQPGVPGQPEIIQSGGLTEVIEPPPAPDCLVRAKHFAGLVPVPCGDVARETKS